MAGIGLVDALGIAPRWGGDTPWGLGTHAPIHRVARNRRCTGRCPETWSVPKRAQLGSGAGAASQPEAVGPEGLCVSGASAGLLPPFYGSSVLLLCFRKSLCAGCISPSSAFGTAALLLRRPPGSDFVRRNVTFQSEE